MSRNAVYSLLETSLMEANGIGEGYFGLSAFPPAHGPQQHDLEDGGRLK